MKVSSRLTLTTLCVISVTCAQNAPGTSMRRQAKGLLTVIPSRFPFITVEQPRCEPVDRCSIPCFHLTRKKDATVRHALSKLYQERTALALTTVSSFGSDVLRITTTFDQVRAHEANTALHQAHTECVAHLERYKSQDPSAADATVDPALLASLVEAVARVSMLKETTGLLYLYELYSRHWHDDMLWAVEDGCTEMHYYYQSGVREHATDAAHPQRCIMGLGEEGHNLLIPGAPSSPRPVDPDDLLLA